MLAAFICTATVRPVQQQSQKLKQLRPSYKVQHLVSFSCLRGQQQLIRGLIVLRLTRCQLKCVLSLSVYYDYYILQINKLMPKKGAAQTLMAGVFVGLAQEPLKFKPKVYIICIHQSAIISSSYVSFLIDNEADTQERCCPDPFGWGICWPCPKATQMKDKGLFSACMSQLSYTLQYLSLS